MFNQKNILPTNENIQTKTNNLAIDFNEMLSKLDDYDQRLLKIIVDLHNASGREEIDINKIENVFEALKQLTSENEYDYLFSLIHPENSKGSKIPSPIPVPSCAFQLHNTVTLQTNSRGNLAFLFNPFFLYDTELTKQTYTIDGTETTLLYASSLYVNNSETLTGSDFDDNFMPVNIGQGIPNVYNQYRLVSASLVVRYIGRMDITSGVIGGAIIFDDNIYSGAKYGNAVSRAGQDTAKYGNFDLAIDSFYHQETNSVNGLKEIYFPLDNTYEEYQRLYLNIKDNDNSFKGLTKNGFQQMVYVIGAPANSSCFKVDIYCNFETLPNASFLNYIPLSVSPKCLSNQMKKETIELVQKKPIMTLKEGGLWANIKKYGKKAFKGLKSFFGSKIGKDIIQAVSKKLIPLAADAIPYFKPAVSLVNQMLANQTGNVNNSFQAMNPNVPKLVENAEQMNTD